MIGVTRSGRCLSRQPRRGGGDTQGSAPMVSGPSGGGWGLGGHGGAGWFPPTQLLLRVAI